MSKNIQGLILGFILIFVGAGREGSFTALFTNQKACEAVITDMKKEMGGSLNIKFWDLLKCYSEGGKYD